MTAQLTRLDTVAWDDLRILLAIADAGSFRSGAIRAKVALNTARSSVTRIEHQMRTPLLTRGVAGVEPTAAGQSAIAAARSVQSLIRYRAVASGEYA